LGLNVEHVSSEVLLLQNKNDHRHLPMVAHRVKTKRPRASAPWSLITLRVN
jgi:hypothetical protein